MITIYPDWDICTRCYDNPSNSFTWPQMSEMAKNAKPIASRCWTAVSSCVLGSGEWSGTWQQITPVNQNVLHVQQHQVHFCFEYTDNFRVNQTFLQWKSLMAFNADCPIREYLLTGLGSCSAVIYLIWYKASSEAWLFCDRWLIACGDALSSSRTGGHTGCAASCFKSCFT